VPDNIAVNMWSYCVVW